MVEETEAYQVDAEAKGAAAIVVVAFQVGMRAVARVAGRM